MQVDFVSNSFVNPYELITQFIFSPGSSLIFTNILNLLIFFDNADNFVAKSLRIFYNSKYLRMM